MSIYTALLFFSETWYAVTHALVLLSRVNIMPNRGSMINKPYFIGDTVSNVVSCVYTGKNKFLSLLHVFLHVPALLHLFGWKISLYKSVFLLARHGTFR